MRGSEVEQLRPRAQRDVVALRTQFENIRLSQNERATKNDLEFDKLVKI